MVSFYRRRERLKNAMRRKRHPLPPDLKPAQRERGKEQIRGANTGKIKEDEGLEA